jgi:hypothetical protein
VGGVRRRRRLSHPALHGRCGELRVVRTDVGALLAGRFVHRFAVAALASICVRACVCRVLLHRGTPTLRLLYCASAACEQRYHHRLSDLLLSTPHWFPKQARGGSPSTAHHLGVAPVLCVAGLSARAASPPPIAIGSALRLAAAARHTIGFAIGPCRLAAADRHLECAPPRDLNARLCPPLPKRIARHLCPRTMAPSFRAHES